MQMASPTISGLHHLHRLHRGPSEAACLPHAPSAPDACAACGTPMAGSNPSPLPSCAGKCAARGAMRVDASTHAAHRATSCVGLLRDAVVMPQSVKLMSVMLMQRLHHLHHRAMQRGRLHHLHHGAMQRGSRTFSWLHHLYRLLQGRCGAACHHRHAPSPCVADAACGMPMTGSNPSPLPSCAGKYGARGPMRVDANTRPARRSTSWIE